MVVPDWLNCSRGEARSQSPDLTNFILAQQRFYLNPPLGETFVVNSEPRTGARPSVRLCVGLINYNDLQCPLFLPILTYLCQQET
jgi:hypothetical protein